MKRYISAPLFISLVLLSACSDKVYIGTETVVDLRESSNEPVLATHLFEVTDTITLKSAPTDMVTAIKRIIPFGGNYFVLDNVRQKCVLVYDNSGNLVRKIGRIGRGNGEYANIEDFAIDESGKRIIILANNSTVYIYALSGNFLEKKELDKSLLWNIVAYTDGYILTTNQLTYTEGENAYLIYHFDKDFRLLEKEVPVLPMQMYTPSTIPICIKSLGSKAVYTDIYTNRSYLIEGNVRSCSTCSYQLKSPMPQKFFSSTNTFMKEQLNYDYIKDNVFLNDYILTFFSEQGTLKVLLTKRNGTPIKSGSYWGIVPPILWTDGNTILSAMPLSNYRSMLGDNTKVTTRSEDSDFVLVKMRLR